MVGLRNRATRNRQVSDFNSERLPRTYAINLIYSQRPSKELSPSYFSAANTNSCYQLGHDAGHIATDKYISKP